MKTLKMKHIALLLTTLVFFQSCNNDDDNATAEDTSIPEVITINEAGLYPGKFDFSTTTNQFIVGSLVQSEIGIVNPRTGEYSLFINDPELVLVSGIYADDENNRLIAASGDFGFSVNSIGGGQVGYLGIYNIVSGEKIQGINLKALLPGSPAVFPNDITVDDNGNIYITDSLNPVIYKVDGATFEASIFLDGGTDFSNISDGAGLLAMNGLAFKDDFLIAAKTDSGELFKIPLNNPSGYYRIGGPLYPGMDGVRLNGDSELIMAETGLGPVEGARIIRTNDNWDSTEAVSIFEIEPGQFPTSVAIAYDGKPYIITSHLLELTVNGNFADDMFNIYRILE